MNWNNSYRRIVHIYRALSNGFRELRTQAMLELFEDYENDAYKIRYLSAFGHTQIRSHYLSHHALVPSRSTIMLVSSAALSYIY